MVKVCSLSVTNPLGAFDQDRTKVGANIYSRTKSKVSSGLAGKAYIIFQEVFTFNLK